MAAPPVFSALKPMGRRQDPAKNAFTNPVRGITFRQTID